MHFLSVLYIVSLGVHSCVQPTSSIVEYSSIAIVVSRFSIHVFKYTMSEYDIILYCVRYDPYLCEVDPERIWEIVQRSRGSVHAGAMGQLLFYVPATIITQVLLMDTGLKVLHGKNYIR